MLHQLKLAKNKVMIQHKALTFKGMSNNFFGWGDRTGNEVGIIMDGETWLLSLLSIN